MTAVEVRQIIIEELDESEINGWHGITKNNVEQYLSAPVLIELSDWEGIRNKYWRLLDTEPADKEKGYLVIYDENERTFGLATKTSMKLKRCRIFSWFVWFFC